MDRGSTQSFFEVRKGKMVSRNGQHDAVTCVFSLFLCGFCVIILIAGCGSSTPISVAINPSNAAIGTGQTSQFTATVTRGSVKWTASAGTIDSTGNYTAPSGTQSMTVTVTATSTKIPQVGQRYGQRGRAGASDGDGQPASGELYHCAGGAREMFPCSLAPIRTTA